MTLKVELLEQSFQLIRPQSAEFADSFYENLFETNPTLKPLFNRSDMKKQQKKLLSSLVLVVENLRKPELLAQVLKDLGARHIQYGVLPEYYPLVGSALLMTFEQYLGPDWTPEVKLAWMDAYGGITNLMLEGGGYSPLPLQSETVPTPSVEVSNAPTPQKATIAISKAATDVAPPTSLQKAPTPQKSSALQVELLERSFAKIKPKAGEFAANFYDNLFEANPEVKPLFLDTDMKKQQKKLLSSLVLVVESLRKPAVLGQVLKDLGARHIQYGVLPKYYPMVGAALLVTFEQCLGPDWTPEVKLAWVDAYDAIANLMLEGAGHTAPSVPLQTVPTPSVGVDIAPIPEKSPVLEIALPQNKSEQIKNLVQEQIKGLSAVFSKGLTVKQIKEKFTYFQEQFVYWFWELPTWGVTLIVVGIVLFLILITDESSILGQVLGSLESLSVVVAVVLFIKEIPERKKQSHYQAWSTIDGAEGVEVSYARFMALQDLNGDGVILRGIKVSGAKLENIDLSRAELSESDFHKADLDEANFERANLNRANISSASLTRVNFSDANLTFANLKDSNLAGSNLKNANLFGADLSNTRLTGVDLSGANLSAANLMGANLSGANLTDTNLAGANLIDAIVPDGFKHK